MRSCPTLYKFGEGVAGPSAGGATTFEESFAPAADLDEVGIVSIVAAFYSTAFLKNQTADLEVDFHPHGVRFVVAPAANTPTQLPVFEAAGIVGRQIIAFPEPLPVPRSPDGSGRRCDVRVLLQNISAACFEWRVFIQTAVRVDGKWVY